MKLLKYMLPVMMVAAGGNTLRADSGSPGVDEPGAYRSVTEARERDSASVRDYIESKRAISLSEKGGNMTLSGEIKAEYSHLKARTNGKNQRGYSSRKLYPNSAIKASQVSKKKYNKMSYDKQAAYRSTQAKMKAPYASDEFAVEAALMLDYFTDNCWAALKLQFNNSAGKVEIDRQAMINDDRRIMYGSGTTSKISLRKAYVGYNAFEEGTTKVDFELGRRKLSDVFDSKLQFYTIFDGALLRYSSSFDGVMDFGVKAAAFVVDYTVNHYGYVGQLDFLNLADMGLDFKYSIIDWKKNGKNRYGVKTPDGTKFLNSQFTLAYTFVPESPQFKTKLYGGYIHNHAAKRSSWSENKKADNAFYAGFQVGDVRKKGDWAFDVAYEWVQAQAIPDADINGYAFRDNPRNISFYNRKSGGFGNYKGPRVDAFFAVTDNWTINAFYKNTRQQTTAIGGKHRSSEFSIASIFAF